MVHLFRKQEAAPAAPVVRSEDDLLARERLIHLRIKVKALAAEAAIIRQEERRVCGLVRWGLQQHRKTVVRRAARESLLAYGLLRGAPYARMERACRTAPDLGAVATVAKRFGGDPAAVAAWVAEAQAYRKVAQQAA
jgi:hypothetical protein